MAGPHSERGKRWGGSGPRMDLLRLDVEVEEEAETGGGGRAAMGRPSPDPAGYGGQDARSAGGDRRRSVTPADSEARQWCALPSCSALHMVRVVQVRGSQTKCSSFPHLYAASRQARQLVGNSLQLAKVVTTLLLPAKRGGSLGPIAGASPRRTGRYTPQASRALPSRRQP